MSIFSKVPFYCKVCGKPQKAIIAGAGYGRNGLCTKECSEEWNRRMSYSIMGLEYQEEHLAEVKEL